MRKERGVMTITSETIKITEKDFSSQIEDLLKIYQWRWTHFRPAFSNKGWRTPLKGYKGFPDIVAVRPPRLLFIELKSESGKLSSEQEAWLEDLKECVKVITAMPVSKEKPLSYYNANHAGTLILPEIYLWKPSQIEEIAIILKG